MNMLSRDELAQSRDAYEEGAEVRGPPLRSSASTTLHIQCRARTWLFCAYLVATAAVATGVTMLIKGQESESLQHAGVVWCVTCVLQEHNMRSRVRWCSRAWWFSLACCCGRFEQTTMRAMAMDSLHDCCDITTILVTARNTNTAKSFVAVVLVIVDVCKLGQLGMLIIVEAQFFEHLLVLCRELFLVELGSGCVGVVLSVDHGLAV